MCSDEWVRGSEYRDNCDYRANLSGASAIILTDTHSAEAVHFVSSAEAVHFMCRSSSPRPQSTQRRQTNQTVTGGRIHSHLCSDARPSMD